MRSPRAIAVTAALVAVPLMTLVPSRVASGAAASIRTASVSQATLTGIHKIQHVIVIMQENRSFDSYFGTYPGADGIPMTNGVPLPCLPSSISSTCVRPYHDPNDINGGGPHGSANESADVDGGAMDGFETQAEKSWVGCWSPRVNVKVLWSQAEKIECPVDVAPHRSDACGDVGVAGDAECTDRQVA